MGILPRRGELTKEQEQAYGRIGKAILTCATRGYPPTEKELDSLLDWADIVRPGHESELLVAVMYVLSDVLHGRRLATDEDREKFLKAARMVDAMPTEDEP